MAKVTGGLLSLDAKGQIGKTMVFASWRGVKYARQLVTPSNPNTTEQQATRNVFRSMDSQWKLMSTLSRAPWDAAAAGRRFTGRNKLMSDNIPVLREEADMLNWIGSPGALGGLSPSVLDANPNATSGELDVDVTSPAEPLGWTLDSVVVQAFLDRDPAVEGTDFVVEQEDNAPVVDGVTSINLTGLNPSELYIVSAWTTWTRPDGKKAYGNSLTTSATPAA